LLDLPNLFDGTIEDSGDARRLVWGPHRLEVTGDPEPAPGTACAWTILPTRVVLHRVDRPSRGEQENPVATTIVDLVTLGDDVVVRLAPAGLPAVRLTLKVSLHVAHRNPLAPGHAVTVSLLRDAIVLLAPG
jgi:molybdate transport system ATP-binding protein